MKNTLLITYRQNVISSDCDAVKEIVDSTGFFSEEESSVAVELLIERLTKGEKSGYYFLFAEVHYQVIAYTCFGRISGTSVSFDLFWIVVQKDFHGHGIGKEILGKTEEIIYQMGGKRIYTETSSRALYESTRQFYDKCGYKVQAVLDDFYAPGDSKIIFLKELHG